ncbi:hypothetical protein [Streptomyces sp. FH025]|uniref:hypothetical protein n=1 Tax=Streptomyces sp. FH025 TaxID=2815937 RepID=UPI001A9CED7E|nr:hypothetical protein [Streptomyces sp. FH025]MBO1414263.1 hypothetical protein [Streptomyces sp. FH025]
MKYAHPRRLGGVAAAAVAAGLLTAPSAAAANTAPTVLGTSQGSEYRAFACDSTTDPIWIGRTMYGPSLNAKVDGTSARFGVWDETTSAEDPVFSGEAQAYAQQAKVAVPGLVDGHSYAWHAWALQGTQTSDPSGDCHFAVDTTSPTATVSSTDFPASGTATKYAGQKGTFVIKAVDPAPAGGAASGIACVRYSFSYLGVGDCDSSNAVKPDGDGTVTVDLKVLNWGTNTLNVQVMDNAGNLGQASYTFYAPSNPNPPKTLGDVDGDGIADILLPDAQGNLQFINVNATDTTPNSTVRSVVSPDRTSWAPFQVAHRGWSDYHAPSADDLFLHKPGQSYLYMYRNFDFGSFSQGWTGADRSTECVDATGADVTCPADYASDWSKADQLIALGPVNDGFDPSLVTLENGNLWLHAGGDFSFGFQKARKLTTTGDWGGYDLVAPGPDAAGNLALWARDRATGELHAYPIPKKADGTFDFSALADSKANVVATGFTTAAYPTLGSSGDADGDGKPDLWAVTADRHLVMYSGWEDPADLGALR